MWLLFAIVVTILQIIDLSLSGGGGLEGGGEGRRGGGFKIHQQVKNLESSRSYKPEISVSHI